MRKFYFNLLILSFLAQISWAQNQTQKYEFDFLKIELPTVPQSQLKPNFFLADSATVTDKKVWQIYTKIKSEKPHYQELETYYLEWYRLRKKDENPEKLAWIARELSKFYRKDEHYEKAFDYAEEFIQLLDTDGFSIFRFWLDYGNYFYHTHSNLKDEHQRTHDFWLLKSYRKALETSKVSDVQPHLLHEMASMLRNYIRYSQKPVNQKVLTFLLEILEYQKKPEEIVRAYLLCASKSQNDDTAQQYMAQALDYALKINAKKVRKSVLLACAVQYQNQFRDYAKGLEIKLKGYDSGIYDSEYFKNNPAQILNYLKDPIETVIMQDAPDHQIQKCIDVLDNFLENHTKNFEKIWAYRLKSRLLQHQKKYKASALERIKLIPLLVENPINEVIDLADVGFLFQLAGDKNNALKYFEKAIEIAQNNYELTIEIPKYILKKAYCLESFKDFQNAEKQYLRAFNLAIENLPKAENHVIFYDAHLLVIYDLTWKISELYAQKNNQTEALKFAKTSLEIARKLPYQHRFKVQNSLDKIKKLD